MLKSRDRSQDVSRPLFDGLGLEGSGLGLGVSGLGLKKHWDEMGIAAGNACISDKQAQAWIRSSSISGNLPRVIESCYDTGTLVVDTKNTVSVLQNCNNWHTRHNV